MGIGGVSVWQLLIVLAIVVLLFGTKRFSNLGADLGRAVKGFNRAVDKDGGLVPLETASFADAKGGAVDPETR